jgi:hypothetical protein
MKQLNITINGMISLLMMSFPLKAESADTPAELQALERELDQEQARLDQRRQELALRKVRLELRKSGREIPNKAELSDEQKAAQLARLQAQAEAGKLRMQWMAQWERARKLQQPEEKGERRMGSPKAFGKRAKEKEEEAAAAKKLVETQIKQFEDYILTSMQTSLAEKGSLNQAELKWLEVLTAEPDEEEGTAPITDEATRRRAKLIMDMEKERSEKPEDGKGGKSVPEKSVPILVE